MNDRLALLDEIWASIATDGQSGSLSDVQKDELDRWWADFEANPERPISREQVEAEAIARLRR